MSELHDLTVLEQAGAIRTGQVGAVELVRHYLARIEAYGADLGAFVTVTGDAAVAAARAADDAVRREQAGLPALHGVPTAIKDLTMTAGVRTTFGSAAFEDLIPPVDADVVTALRDAGMISLGKTTTSEFGISLYSEGLVAPPARNPWQPEMTAGGSSGGAAAAVAAGLVPVAQGSDGGGSLRIPAAICGLVGFKPSRGVVPTGPFGFGGFGLPTDGPIGRTVCDVALVLDAMAVPAGGQPYQQPPRPVGGYLTQALHADPGRLRIGWFTTPILADVPVDPVCLAAVAQAAGALAGLGHDLVEVPAPADPSIMPLFETVWQALTLWPVPPDREDRLLPLTRHLRGRAAQISAAELMGALGGLQSIVRDVDRKLAGFDLVLCPTLARPQAPVGWFAGLPPAEDFAEQARMSPYCALVNLTGGAGISVPVGRTGVMLFSSPGADGLVLSVAAQLETVLPWADRHPAVWRAAASATVDPS